VEVVEEKEEYNGSIKNGIESKVVFVFEKKSSEESSGGKAFKVSEFNHICPPIEDE
jgi:hypothetical protein